MNIDFIQTLYEYHYRARDVVIDCAHSLTEADYMRPLDYSMGSIHEQLVHTMSAEVIWFSRLRGNSPTQLHSGADFPTLDDLVTYWDKVVKPDVHLYLNQLTPELLATDVNYQTTKGEPQREATLGLLLHVINHATDHRAQTLAMIHTLGGRTAPQDLIYYLRGKL